MLYMLAHIKTLAMLTTTPMQFLKTSIHYKGKQPFDSRLALVHVRQLLHCYICERYARHLGIGLSRACLSEY